MVKRPNKDVGRALQHEAELDDDALDAIVAGRGPSRAIVPPEEDGWSQIVDDHAKAIPAASPGARGAALGRGRKGRSGEREPDDDGR